MVFYTKTYEKIVNSGKLMGERSLKATRLQLWVPDNISDQKSRTATSFYAPDPLKAREPDPFTSYSSGSLVYQVEPFFGQLLINWARWSKWSELPQDKKPSSTVKSIKIPLSSLY